MFQKLMAKRAFSTAQKKTVGFIGLGNMGLPMTNNLVKNGFAVRAFDLSQERIAAAGKHGCVEAKSVKDAVQGADYIVTCLPNGDIVTKTLQGDDGVFKNAVKGAKIIDVSTISSLTSVELVEQAEENGLRMFDSPMSGGIMRATDGSLTFMVGADDKGLDEIRDPLSAMGANLFACGAPGTGSIAKIVNNHILGIIMMGTSEALALGEKLGGNAKALSDILAVSTGGSFVVQKYNPVPGVMEGVPAARQYAGGFAVDLMLKDLNLAVDLADKIDAKAVFATTARDHFAEISKKGQGDKDYSFAYQYIKRDFQI